MENIVIFGEICVIICKR